MNAPVISLVFAIRYCFGLAPFYTSKEQDKKRVHKKQLFYSSETALCKPVDGYILIHNVAHTKGTLNVETMCYKVKKLSWTMSFQKN